MTKPQTQDQQQPYASQQAGGQGGHQADPANRSRLRWRSRRGLLENDLLLTRFLDAHEADLSDDDVDALTRLLDLADQPLLDLLLSRAEPVGEVDMPHVRALLVRLRQI